MPAGRPLLFKNKKELQDKIDAYFDSCWQETKEGKKQIKPYTITGLAVSLDTSRQTLLEYEGEVTGREEKSKEFADTIKKAKDIIEGYNEEQLYRNTQVAGVIFNLKNNYEWKEKTETDITTKGKEIQPNTDLDELAKLMASKLKEEKM